jgi:hypothetical protein
MIIDLIFIILICLFAIYGYKKGMVFSLFSLFAVTSTILLVYIFVPIVIELLSRVINFEKLGELLTRIGINGDNAVSKLYKLTVLLFHFDIQNSIVLSVYLLTTMICYIILYILIKPKVKVLYKSIYNKTKNKLEYNRLDNLFGVFMGLIRGYVFIFFIAVYLNILCDMSIFADSIKVQLASSSYIQFFNDIFSEIFNI